MERFFKRMLTVIVLIALTVTSLPMYAYASMSEPRSVESQDTIDSMQIESGGNSVTPCLTPSYTPSSPYRSSKYYTQLCNVSLTGNQRTDLVNVVKSQLGYHEGDSFSDLGGGNTSGSSNYTEYGYWYGTQVAGSSGGYYYAWCAYFISWCARQARISTSIISNASHACAGNDDGDFKNLTYYERGSYTPKAGDLIFFDWASQSGPWDHVEVVVGVSSSSVTTIGGNTGDSNVKERSWSLSNSSIQGYGVPKYSSSTPDPTPPNPDAPMYRTLATAGLNMRSGPGNNYDRVAIIPYSSFINITEINSHWGKTTYNGVTGWVYMDYCALIPTPSSNPGNSTNPTKYAIPMGYLNVGDSGNGVRWLQACLYQLGYSIDIDGQFGDGTASALMEFQRDYDLTVDGGMGPQVRKKLLDLLTVSKPTISYTTNSSGATVTITCSTSNSKIYYTKNGATPTESSTRYTAPFKLTSSGTVRAFATKSSRYPSAYRTVVVNVPVYHTVVFKDYDGTVLSTQQVEHGKAAVAPSNPTRPGYTFTGWNKPFNNVTSDLTITAQYTINTYTVTFKDWDGTVLKTQTVNYGGSATAPANPSRPGYTFTGWDRPFNNVTSNLTVTAQYTINTYTVTFKDWDGSVLKTQTVNHGSDATPPADPSREGYIFIGWSGSYTNVTQNLVITAQYEAEATNPPVTPTPIPDEDAIEFKLESVNAMPGNEASVDLTMSGDYEAHGLTLFIHYDPEMLSINSEDLIRGAVWNDITNNGGVVVFNTDEAGIISFMVIMPVEAFSAEGVLFSMNFTVSEDAEMGEEVPLSIEVSEFFNAPVGGENTAIEFFTTDGAVNVNMNPGDVDGDGIVSAADAILIMRHALSIIHLEGAQFDLADYDGDGVITASDALNVMRVALGSV